MKQPEEANMVKREKLTVLLNEADIRRMAEIAYSKDINQRIKRVYNGLKITLISIYFVLLAVCAVIAVKSAQNTSGSAFGRTAVIPAVVLVIFFILFIIAVSAGRKKLKKRAEAYYQNELARRKNGFLPRIYTFEKDGIHTVGRYSDFVVSYEELQECHEYADGIFFRYESGQILWLPARFFTKGLAEEVSGAMKYVFMKNYFLHEKLSATETPEAVTAEQLIMPQGEPYYTIEYKSNKFDLLQRAVNAAIGRKMLIYVLAIFMLFYIGKIAVNIASALIARVGTPFGINAILETVCLILCITGIVFLGFTIIYTLVLTPYKIYKAGAGWVREGTKLELYENGMMEKIAAGRTFTPWDNLQTVLYSAGDLVLMDKAGRGIVIPESALKENRAEIENAIRAHLPHEHEHDEHCDCGCGHEHHHEHGEHCSCKECEKDK